MLKSNVRSVFDGKEDIWKASKYYQKSTQDEGDDCIKRAF